VRYFAVAGSSGHVACFLYVTILSKAWIKNFYFHFCWFNLNNPHIQWILVNWGSRLFGTNPKEQKQIKNITRICFAYLGHHAV
jgi:hypothetical protein